MSTRAPVQIKQQHEVNHAARGMRLQGTREGAGLGADVMSLQRSAGNSSVNNLINSLDGNTTRSQRAPASVDSAIDSAPLEDAIKSLPNIPPDQALRVLKRYQQYIIRRVTTGEARIRDAMSLRAESFSSYLIGGTIEVFGGTSLPSDDWVEPWRHVNGAYSTLSKRQVKETLGHLNAAAEATNRRWEQLNKYLDQTEKGADRSIFALQALQAAGAVAATALTGGGATAIVVGAGYGAAQNIAGQATAVNIGIQSQIDWGALAFDTLFGVLTGALGGKLGTTVLEKLMGNKAVASLGRRVVAEVVSDLVSGRLSSILQTTARSLFDQLRRKEDLTVEEFLHRLADQLMDPKAMLLDAIMGRASKMAHSSSSKAPKTSASKSSTTVSDSPTKTPVHELVRPATTEPTVNKPMEPVQTAEPVLNKAAKSAIPEVPVANPAADISTAKTVAAEPPTISPTKPVSEPATSSKAPEPQEFAAQESAMLPKDKGIDSKTGESDSDFTSVAEHLKSVPEGKGPVVGQKLGGLQEVVNPQLKPAPRREKTSEAKKAEEVLLGRMRAQRRAEGTAKLEDPTLRAIVEQSAKKKETFGDKKTTLQDMAADSPELVSDLWKRWKHGKAKGRIKSKSFKEYVDRRMTEFRGTAGEKTLAFRTGPGEIMVKAPKGSVTAPGSDMLTYRVADNKLVYYDNKAFGKGAKVDKVSALEWNLLKNMGEDIRDLERDINKGNVSPGLTKVVLPKLKGALADLNAYDKSKLNQDKTKPWIRKRQLASLKHQKAVDAILKKHGIERAVTTEAGAPDVIIGDKLVGKGFKQD